MPGAGPQHVGQGGGRAVQGALYVHVYHAVPLVHVPVIHKLSGIRPALFACMSTRPHLSTTPSTNAWHWSCLVMFTVYEAAVPPLSQTPDPPAVRSAGPSATRMPFLVKTKAVPRPMPPLAPVTPATLSDNVSPP